MISFSREQLACMLAAVADHYVSSEFPIRNYKDRAETETIRAFITNVLHEFCRAGWCGKATARDLRSIECIAQSHRTKTSVRQSHKQRMREEALRQTPLRDDDSWMLD